MRQVMRTRPWVLPAEPERFVEVFRRYGREVIREKGQTLRHGGLTGEVALLLEGLVTFSFLDVRELYRTFALILPGRAVGDLDALNPHRTNVIAEAIRPSRFLVMKNSDYRAALRGSVENMELYADLSILKEESVLEGAFANFTMDLDSRLRVLFLSLVLEGHGSIRPGDWTPSPVALTVTEIARIVAGNRSWVSTKISEWLEQGLIRRKGRTFEFRSELFDPVHDWRADPKNVQPESISVA